ncbi:putative Diacylglycerol acyltransferase [Trypanosoma vivax]|uniref:Acyltransferase n=1 Tax=Trypanosoma vivax (strain Y486) TaxID=1055687 RepID=G0TSI2_TRYVY|nr:putative diacylglycerol acyltransferase [Trypanosoma vivax]KAH8605731.1 putative Diacylglycerol acyltransferase [Trypanosoma vivax]CCC46909.1 putative diacylglycerol acyltransferase [Trypanosoma vivax Y486]
MDASGDATVAGVAHNGLDLKGPRCSSPSNVREKYALLDHIIEACDRLQEVAQSRPITAAEVAKLRKAYLNAVGVDDEPSINRKVPYAVKEGGAWSQCDNVSASGGESAQPGLETGRTHELRDSKVLACERAVAQLEALVGPRSRHDPLCNSESEKGWFGANSFVGRQLRAIVLPMLIFYTFIPLSVFLTLFLLLHLYTMPLMMLYIVYIATAGQPVQPIKKTSAVVKHWLFHGYSDYFPVRLVLPRSVRQRFDSKNNYIFVYHPHGLQSFGAISTFMLDALHLSSLLPGIEVHLQTLKINFFVPFWRELILLGGCGDASADCIRSTLSAGPGESVALVVGGANESLQARPSTNDLTLLGRKGFIKIALEQGAPLVPVYGFGENDVYHVPRFAQSQWWTKVLATVRRVTKFAIPIVTGRGLFDIGVGHLPHQRPITVVIGEPLVVPKLPDPTPGDVEQWHRKYVEALQSLFDEYHRVYDVDSAPLRIL